MPHLPVSGHPTKTAEPLISSINIIQQQQQLFIYVTAPGRAKRKARATDTLSDARAELLPNERSSTSELSSEPRE